MGMDLHRAFVAWATLVATVGLGEQAHAQMVAGTCPAAPATCASMYNKSAGICDTEAYTCDAISLPFGGDVLLCESTTYSKPPVNTACESDGNPCTTDACGGTAGATTGNGVCMHTAVANGTTCGTNMTCTSGACGCAGGYVECAASGTCIVSSPTTCCDNSGCTGGHVCTAPGGSCVCPANEYDCGGTCISTANCCSTANCTGGNVCTGANGSCVCPGGTYNCNGTCISTANCCTTANCTGGNVCTGANGSCVCPAGLYECSGTCISTTTCCVALANCTPPANGTSSCPGSGQQCAVTCNANYHNCGTSCEPCCQNSDCPGNAANFQQGVCAGSMCTLQCIANYKACGTTCIPSSHCCSSSDCTTPANGCYVTQGTCTAGQCSYAFNNGAACNADNTKCTPNDTCNNGVCNADTAHQVMCVQRDCHTKPTCDPTSGDCVDSNVTDGMTCGANGCSTMQGMCKTGVCSTTPKDCSYLNTACQVGTCDASKPVGTPCTAVNKPNSTTCTLTDRCELTPSCSGGTCVGTAMPCAPSGACRVDTCDSMSGSCEETVATVGSSCSVAGSCQQNSTCNAAGDCKGDPVPDDTPCQLDNCTTAAICKTGACTCIADADLAGGSGVSVPDGGTTTTKPAHKGCSATPGEAPSSSLMLLGLALALVVLRRRA